MGDIFGQKEKSCRFKNASPWGLAQAPHEFGKFGREVLLVGNIGDGKINAFDINSGAFIAYLNNRRGKPLDFDNLWALFFFNDRLFPESILLPFDTESRADTYVEFCPRLASVDGFV